MPRPVSFSFAPVLRGVLFSAILFAVVSHTLPALAGGSVPARYAVGMRSFGVWSEETLERLDVSVWYPSLVDGEERIFDGWVVESGRRGRIVPGFFPVVLISHDTAGGRFAHNDLAAHLASSGLIVIAPTHARDNQNEADAVFSAGLLRDRPRHLLRALETVLDSPDFAPHADESRIGLLGVGFGSITVLQLAGAVPDFSSFAGYCENAPEADAFCVPWARERLKQMAEGMFALENWRGRDDPRSVFAPPLDLFAPHLVRVAVPDEKEGNGKSMARPKSSLTLWERFFSRKKDRDEAAAEEAAQKTGEDALDAVPEVGENFPMHLDFQGGPRFGGTDSGGPFIYIALPDSPEYRVSVAEHSTEHLAGPEPEVPLADPAAAFRRPADRRTILAVALMAPAGGMFFDARALAGITMPVCILEAGQDGLYPPQGHSRPFVGALPYKPDMLVLDDVDHFSLFANCSRDSVLTLGDTCGRLTGDARDAVAAKRNRFMAAFFESALGGALPPDPHSGLVAAPRRGRE